MYILAGMSDVGVGNFGETMLCRLTYRRHAAKPTSHVANFRPRQCLVVSVGSRHVGFTYIGTSTKNTIVRKIFSTYSLPLAPNHCE
jgi:hypothetical protein